MLSDEQLRQALRRAFNFGQSYFAQSDSESIAANRRADVTHEKFKSFVEETVSAAGLDASHTLNTVDEGRGADPAGARLASDLPEARSGGTRLSENQRQGGDQRRPSTPNPPPEWAAWVRDLRGVLTSLAHQQSDIGRSAEGLGQFIPELCIALGVMASGEPKENGNG